MVRHTLLERKMSPRKSPQNARRLGIENLEDRRLLTAFELSSLLAKNGGDGSAGFVTSGPTGTTGNFVSLSSDINHDGYADLLVADPGAKFPITPPHGKKEQFTKGTVFVVYGTAQGIPPELDLSSLDGANGFPIYGNPDDYAADLATMVASGGDVNGDGIDDVVISGDRSGEGRVYVLFGNAAWGATAFPTSFKLQNLTSSYGGDGSQGFVITGESYFGDTASLDGDVNGDGINDLVLGSQFLNGNAGETFVLFGSANPFPAELSTSNVLAGHNGLAINGVATNDFSGYSVSAGGDLNGDLLDDIVIGARRGTPDQQRIHAGQVFVVYGNTNFGDTSFPNTIELSDILAGDGTAGFVINAIRGDTGNAETFVSGDKAGSGVYSGGDFNGDLLDDLVIGAAMAPNDSGAAEAGEAYVIYGRATGDDPFPAIIELSELNGVDGVTIRGVDGEDTLGRFALVNFNGDGYADLVLTAPGGDPDGRIDAGETYVVFGFDTAAVPTEPVSVIDLAAIVTGDGSAGIVIHGIDAGDFSGGVPGNYNYNGNGLATGDFNGDGFDDVVLGTGYFTPEAYVVFGGANIIPPPPAPSFSINDITVTEGDSGTLTAEFTVTRAGNTSGTDSVNYATENDTALAGSDFTAIPPTPLTFLAGETSLAVTVTIHGDTDEETDETFFVNLTNPSTGATITDGQGVGTILDDDAPVSAAVLYVYDIRFDSKRGGKDWRAVFEIRSDSNTPMAGVSVTVTFAGETYSGTTDSNGVFRTNWIQNLGSGDYYAEAVDLALTDFDWDHLLDVPGDYDDDLLPDELLSI